MCILQKIQQYCTCVVVVEKTRFCGEKLPPHRVVSNTLHH